MQEGPYDEVFRAKMALRGDNNALRRRLEQTK
jgi:hypothetical protein